MTEPERITEIGEVEELDRNDHRRAAAVGLIALIAVVAFGVLGVGSLISDDDPIVVPRVIVPDSTGKNVVAAQSQLERLGLIVDTKFESNEVRPVDEVVGQEPIAGARLEVGQRVVLSVSDGPAGIEIADFSGVQAADAAQQLEASGLVATYEDAFDDEIRPGEVVGTRPGAGNRAPPGSTVVILVSRGPEPRVVPDVAESSVVEAMVQIGRAELTVAEIVERSVDDAEAGTVIGTDPPAGTKVPPGMPIDVVIVALPRLVDVPDFVSLTTASARAVAEQVGLAVRTSVQTVAPGDGRDGRVISQSTVATSRVAPGTTVKLVVGAAPTPTTTTTTTLPPRPSPTTTEP